MKYLFFSLILFFLGCTSDVSKDKPIESKQDTIVIHRTDTIKVVQSDQDCKPYATICGIFEGKLMKSKFLKEGTVEISNHSKVESFEVRIVAGGIYIDNNCVGNSLSKEVKDVVCLLKNGTHIYIDKIVGIDMDGNEFKLNPIHLQIN